MFSANQVSTSHLKLEVFTPKNDNLNHNIHYQMAFQLWIQVWSETYSELGLSQEIFSDAWLNNDQIICIFHDDLPIGSFFLNNYQIENSIQLRLKYFASYPSGLITILQNKKIKNFSALSYLTVHSEWRKSNKVLPVAECLAGMSVQVLKHSNNDAMITYTRNDRKINELGMRYGAYQIGNDFLHNNIPASFLLFDKKLTFLHHNSKQIVEDLWNSYYNKEPIQQRITA